MADYNLICGLCSHGPHTDKQCASCDCKEFLRLDVALIKLVDMGLTALNYLISTVRFQNSLLKEIYPDQAATVLANINTTKEIDSNDIPNRDGVDSTSSDATSGIDRSDSAATTISTSEPNPTSKT